MVQCFIKRLGRPKKEEQRTWRALGELASFAAMKGEEESLRTKLNNDDNDVDDHDDRLH